MNTEIQCPQTNRRRNAFFAVFKYKCSFPSCDLEFKRKDRLDAHEFTHSKVKKFKCTEPNCDKVYATNSHLQRHKRTYHAKSDVIVHCTHESCGIIFESEAKLKAHCSLIHSEKLRMEFECEICKEKFRRKTQLKQHMFDHTGVHRYNCDKCGKGFLLMSRLERHANSHKIRKCEHCDLTFDKWSLFRAHKNKVHLSSELKCSICDKEFHSKRVLKQHRKTHTDGEQTGFQCPFEGCTKFFLYNKNMLAHYKSKHEKVKFSCTYDGCTSKLSTKQKLDLHIKVVHLGESERKPKPKKEQNRAVRKDKGVQKVSTASKFFKIILPPEVERAIIAGHGKNIHIEYDRIEENDDNDHENIGDSEILQLTTTNITTEAMKC